MPLHVENKLKARASRKGFTGKRWKAYVYGTMNKRGLLASIHPRLVELAERLRIADCGVRIEEFDDRRRNSMGEFVGNETEGIDPNSMAAAYGPPAVQPVNPMTESHISRIKRFFGKRREAAE